MIEEKKLKEVKERMIRFIQEGIIKTKQKNEFTEFFLKNAEDSLDSAKILYLLSSEEEKQKQLGLTSFNGSLWVVNASYYSMFYCARALLESEGIKLRTDFSIHALTFDALTHFFYLSGRIQKSLLQDFILSKQEASEMIGKQIADELIEEYFLEKEKRAKFTYEMGEILLKTKAKTSLDRAIKFNRELRKIIKRS